MYKEKIALGTVQFGLDYGISNSKGKTDIKEVEEIVSFARKSNIAFIDTAIAYGSAQKVLGEVGMSDFKVVSKFISPVDEKGLIDQLENSLNELKINSLYGFMAHRPSELIDNSWIWKKLLDFKSNGLVKKIGFSFNEVSEVEKVLEKGFIPDIIQIPFNYLDNRFVAISKYLKEKHGTEIHTRSTFLQGLFFMDINDLSDFFNPVKPLLSSIQSKNLSGKLLKHSIEKDWIDRVVIGVNSIDQLTENINSLSEIFESLPELNTRIEDRILKPSEWQIR